MNNTSTEYIHADLVADYLSRMDMAVMAEKYKKSEIFLQIKIRSSIKLLGSALNQSIQPEFYQDPLKHLSFWKTVLAVHKLRKKLEDPFTLESDFVKHFADLPLPHRQKLITTFKNNLGNGTHTI
ncbi:MAG TPA: hypothetical protein VGQ59_17695 [Cyclobacteriaceae bacterium]|nr:hypothetical protein [Cyclobacteriaceae bacterium]